MDFIDAAVTWLLRNELVARFFSFPYVNNPDATSGSTSCFSSGQKKSKNKQKTLRFFPFIHMRE
jgi:hypothetical protein